MTQRNACSKNAAAREPTETHVVTTSAGNVRITTPAATSQRKKPNVTVMVTPDELVREHVGGFVNFLREHAIVGLAVGFVIATQVQGVVKQLIAQLLDPLYKLLFGTKLSLQTFTLHFHGRAAQFGWGSIVYALIDFFFVVAAIYSIIRFFKLDKLDKLRQ